MVLLKRPDWWIGYYVLPPSRFRESFPGAESVEPPEGHWRSLSGRYPTTTVQLVKKKGDRILLLTHHCDFAPMMHCLDFPGGIAGELLTVLRKEQPTELGFPGADGESRGLVFGVRRRAIELRRRVAIPVVGAEALKTGRVALEIRRGTVVELRRKVNLSYRHAADLEKRAVKPRRRATRLTLEDIEDACREARQVEEILRELHRRQAKLVYHFSRRPVKKSKLAQ